MTKGDSSMVTREDIEVIQNHLDERYVLQSDCNDTQLKINSKLANDDKRIEILIQQQRINNWLTLAIASGIIALVIKVFLGG